MLQQGLGLGAATLAILALVLASPDTVKREADYTLDESFWKEEDSPVGEVERLLKAYRQNREMVRNIGAHYYQIIYPVQLRHHEKMGISTREIGSKYPQRGHGDGGDYASRGRIRTGKHFHRTSLLIKAFNYKFRLDLELNAQLLAPNLVQKHYLQGGAEQIGTQEIEHCYYHGTVKDYPGGTAAFHTCQGVSGVIHVGNETFVIHPFYGGDLSKHPHVIFEARTKPAKGCANSGNEWRMKVHRKTKHVSNFAENRYRRDANTTQESDFPFSEESKKRTTRDVRDTTKYIEAAIVLDKTMFEKRNGSTRAEVVHDAIQVANIADLYFKQVNTRVSVVYIETWQGQNKIVIDRNQDISRALNNFIDYGSRNMFKVDKDTTQLLTGESFLGGEVGVSVPETICTPKSAGISVDINPYEPHILGGTMAHMIGHNVGMSHDDGRDCVCRDWHGCIMAQSIVGMENLQPYKFSECSKNDYFSSLRSGAGMCLMNKPNEFESRPCGNGVVDEGEDCDCGGMIQCADSDPCCDPITCKLKSESECSAGPCCDNCRLRPANTICRAATNECDLAERCDGESGKCPIDSHRKNGVACSKNRGTCFNGFCPTLNLQCEKFWGSDGEAADNQCFEQFNTKGSINGHCGLDTSGQFIKCAKENVRCGNLQCQLGETTPSVGPDYSHSRTIISMKGLEYECKVVNGPSTEPNGGLVLDGTPCGDQLICVNQTCTSIFPHVDNSRCPTNLDNHECSGKGTCSHFNKCVCDLGWLGADCSIEDDVSYALTPMLPPLPTQSAHNASITTESTQMRKIDTPYENQHSTDTVFLVGMLMSVVGGVFVLFALMALCYRHGADWCSWKKYRNLPAGAKMRKSTMPQYELPYVKKPMLKKTASGSAAEEAGMDSANKILTFGTTPSYSRGDQHRVLFRPVNHLQLGAESRIMDHKSQQMKRTGLASGSEEDPMVSGTVLTSTKTQIPTFWATGEEESVAFIDLPPNNLSKLPEKGILKKSGPYGSLLDGKDKWGDDSQSDNQEILSQSDNNLGEGGSTIAEVERTLKSLNGYHEDILEALRTAASHSSHRPPGGLGMHTPSGSSSLLSEEILRKSILDVANYKQSRGSRGGSQEKICEHGQTHTVLVDSHRREDDEDDELPPSCGPIRIRNLEDLIRQLEHHSARHMSPSGSEDIRMSETEADRHYRLESSDSQGLFFLYLSQRLQICDKAIADMRGRLRVRATEEEPRFVYGRYRHPSSRTHSSPHTHQHGAHSYMQEEEGIYESADHDRAADCGDTPDSESDEFIQAQQAQARNANGGGEEGCRPREYYPSPASTSSEDSSPSGPLTAAPEYNH